MNTIIGLLWLAVVIYVLYLLWTGPGEPIKKVLWTLLILFLPLLGVILWVLLGRKPAGA